MYTALEKMRKKNLETYKIDGPEVPETISRVRKNNSERMPGMRYTEASWMETHAIHFVREQCEDLRFRTEAKYLDLTDNEGTSMKKGQIPYNMEKDLDRLCLETAVHRFLESGVAEDAFDIYYIYLEMFMGEYNRSKRLIESLSEFESNASSLLMSHRDHYSHSVYVFLIGLAIYDSSESFRSKYNCFYGCSGHEAAHHFLKYWGLASLFHDIGYPFELPFEEVKSYFNKDRKDIPYIGYLNMNKFIEFADEETTDASKLERKRKASCLMGGQTPGDMADILAWRINGLLGSLYEDRPRLSGTGFESGASYEKYLKEVLTLKPKDPGVFDAHMDHAYFSAVLLMDYLFDTLPEDEFRSCGSVYSDVLTAIVLHNSIFKHIVQAQKKEGFDPGRHALPAGRHPLAYLLMLCDELQCWDRTSYGQDSRTEVHAMACSLVIEGNQIYAQYRFDKAMEKKAGRSGVRGTYKKMKAKNGDVVPEFQRDIEEIVALNREGELNLSVSYEFTDDIKYRKTYLSQSNFMHLYDFAVILSGRRDFPTDKADQDKDMRREMEERFEEKSLEYKIIDIERVKKFARYLDEINCFYTDRAVAYPPLAEFTDDDMDKIGPLEHERWLWIHHIMGWKYGDEYTRLPATENGHNIREITRTHKLMLKDGVYNHENAVAHYKELDEKEQDKDKEPMNKLLEILAMLDGVKFYRIPQITDNIL